ncbi:MAG: hypothetical protein OXC08_20785 [Thiotrichales bacterium]|nr:hypothetical protein [Thiotrichales bacterium]
MTLRTDIPVDKVLLVNETPLTLAVDVFEIPPGDLKPGVFPTPVTVKLFAEPPPQLARLMFEGWCRSCERELAWDDAASAERDLWEDTARRAWRALAGAPQ